MNRTALNTLLETTIETENAADLVVYAAKTHLALTKAVNQQDIWEIQDKNLDILNDPTCPLQLYILVSRTEDLLKNLLRALQNTCNCGCHE